ncbi:hypothetical protein [Mycobacterium malmoense]|uniref:hypothetical protein n=1 Tax=Mycobacterium malmoense TaxID=1780 RepID=UPI00111C0979|nr:hypothetical protein [Mycobacterium malmoense]UNB96120.1 hypothetical protein H5T25_09710 [Mycobacterium malmoense]
MDLAARPHITAGIALASAAVVAAGPVAQHLPDLGPAQHQVSVSDIKLTDAASGMVDLFTGVENELASLVSGASAAAVPASVVSNAINPVQAWINAFESAGTNIQSIFNTWSKTPFPVLQQIAANGIQYGSIYAGAFQTSANDLAAYFSSGAGTTFWNILSTAQKAFAAGNISSAMGSLYSAFWGDLIVFGGLPLEQILNIPIDVTQNIANATLYGLKTGLSQAVTWGVLDLPEQPWIALGTSLQAISTAWGAGDPVGLLTNIINIPGAMVNAFLNGAKNNSTGLLSAPITGFPHGDGLVNVLVNSVLPNLAEQIVVPGAQNVVGGGSLVTAIQNFANKLITGWPSASTLSGIGGAFGSELTALLQSVPSALSSLPSTLGTIATQLGTLLINLLRML